MFSGRRQFVDVQKFHLPHTLSEQPPVEAQMPQHQTPEEQLQQQTNAPAEDKANQQVQKRNAIQEEAQETEEFRK